MIISPPVIDSTASAAAAPEQVTQIPLTNEFTTVEEEILKRNEITKTTPKKAKIGGKGKDFQALVKKAKMTILSEENTFNEGNVDEADGFNSQGPPVGNVIPQAASSNGSLLGALS